MRARTVPLLLAAILVAAGHAGVVGQATARTGSPQESPQVAAEQSTPTRNDTDLLTREELFAAIGANASDHEAALYFIAENGTWYHASSNDSVGSLAPDGAEIPKMAEETHEIPRDQRPTYRWKVVSADECSTTFYDASNASDPAPYAIPGCPPSGPSPTAPTGTSSPEDDATESTTTDHQGTPDTTTGGPQHGFGAATVGVGVLAGWFAIRE